MIKFTEPEMLALIEVMSARYENVVETRQQTADEEYDQTDEDQCSSILFQLSDWTQDGWFDDDALSSLGHLDDALWIAFDTPEAFEVDYEVLRSAAVKLNYDFGIPDPG